MKRSNRIMSEEDKKRWNKVRHYGKYTPIWN